MDLQGHEDLRQDERVMQLFGLVNAMLSNDRSTAERDLSIARYAVIPLSPNSGEALLHYYRSQKERPEAKTSSHQTDNWEPCDTRRTEKWNAS